MKIFRLKDFIYKINIYILCMNYKINLIVEKENYLTVRHSSPPIYFKLKLGYN